MRPDDYTVLQGWMYALPLTEKQRLVYALIYGYSRDGRSRMRATAAYLAEWLECTPRHAQKIVRALEDKGLIAHEVVPTKTGCVSEFWVLMEHEKTEKKKINWNGKPRRGYGLEDVRGYGLGIATPYTGSNNINNPGCGKNIERSRAKETTTTGFLFEQNESGLAPGNPCVLPLPFDEEYFVEAWKKLLRQPKWAEKTPEALEIVLRRFDETGDPILSAFCCLKAIEKGWSTISDPSDIGLKDQDQLTAYADSLHAQEEGAAA